LREVSFRALSAFFAAAQGIEAEIPQALIRGRRNWSGKPGFQRFCAGNAPKFSKKIFVTLNRWLALPDCGVSAILTVEGKRCL
jgi:hypothetical protein